MSEKVQHTSAKLRIEMQAKYGDEIHHKHNKLNHRPYRQHWKSHPVEKTNGNGITEIESINQSTGIVRKLNQNKLRKRMDKGHYH